MKDSEDKLKYPHIFKVQKFMFLASKNLDRLLDNSFDIGFSQCMILLFVENNPRVSQRHISNERDITPAAVSRHVESLVEKGYLRQEENRRNKREHILEVSAEGERVARRMVELMNEELDRMFHEVNRREMDEIDRLFTKLLMMFGR